jgi:hypothetical protein
MTISDPPGTTIRSPKTARRRALRSGQGAIGPRDFTGARRATGLRRRVTSMVSARSTRAMTRFRCCWSSRPDTVAFAMLDIMSDNLRRVRRAPLTTGYAGRENGAGKHSAAAETSGLTAPLSGASARDMPSFGRRTACSADADALAGAETATSFANSRSVSPPRTMNTPSGIRNRPTHGKSQTRGAERGRQSSARSGGFRRTGSRIRTARISERTLICRFLEIGGESGIRTHGRVSPTHAFQACAFNHSAISPRLESTVCERSAAVYRTRRRIPSLFCDAISIQRFTDRRTPRSRKLCQTS